MADIAPFQPLGSDNSMTGGNTGLNTPISPLNGLSAGTSSGPPTIVNLNPTQTPVIGGAAGGTSSFPSLDSYTPATAANTATPATMTPPGSVSPPAAAAPQVATSTGATALPPGSRAGNLYIEDLTDQKYIPSTVPISFRYGNNDVSQETGKSTMSGQFHRDQSVIGSVFEQIYGGGVMGPKSAVQVELEIRGDPFWLGQTNFDRAVQYSDPANPTYTKGVVDQMSGKFIAFLHFRYPTTVGDDFVPVLSSNDVFSGLYDINQVVHTFSEGVFKQKLTAVRHLLVANNSGNPPSSGDNSGNAPSTTPATPAAAAPAAVPTPVGPTSANGANTNTPITVDDTTA